MNEVGILGSGAQASELADYFLASGTKITFFAVDREFINKENKLEIDIANLTQENEVTPVVIGAGAPALKKKLIDEWKGKIFARYIDKTAWVSSNTILEEGVIICPNATITTGSRISDHVLVNIGATISHDVSVGAFSTIGPGANIAGHVNIGKGVFIGSGAVIKNDISIAEGCIIGAGAVVIDSIKEKNSVVVGNPAKLIKVNQGWMSEI